MLEGKSVIDPDGSDGEVYSNSVMETERVQGAPGLKISENVVVKIPSAVLRGRRRFQLERLGGKRLKIRRARWKRCQTEDDD